MEENKILYLCFFLMTLKNNIEVDDTAHIVLSEKYLCQGFSIIRMLRE